MPIKALSLVLLAALVAGCGKDLGRCEEGFLEKRTRKAWVQFIVVGNVTVPIHHPAREYDEWVCTKWEFPEGKPTKLVK